MKDQVKKDVLNLGSFAKLRKAAMRFVVSIFFCTSVLLHETTRLPLYGLFI